MFGRFLRIALINVVVVLGLAVGAELIFGTWFSSDPIDRLAVLRDLSARVDASTLYPGGHAFLYRRDHWGFRGPGTDPATITIMTIGGSTTNQLYLPFDQTWQAVLQREFRAHGQDVVIANAGIDGQSTVGNVTDLEDWLPYVPGLKPRFILAYIGINDTDITGPAIDDLKYSSWNKEAKQRSALWKLIHTVQGMLKARRLKLTHHAVDYAHAQWVEAPERSLSDPPSGSSSNPERYRERVGLMADRIRALGAIPIFVTQERGDARIVDGKLMGLAGPDGQGGIDEYRRLARLNAITLEVCRAKGGLCLDLAGDLRLGDGDFYDLLHNTPQGAEKIGRWLYGKLADVVRRPESG